MKTRKSVQSMYQKNAVIINRRRQKALIHYIVEENIFAVIVYKLLERDIKDCFTINGEQRIQMSKNGENVKLNNFKITVYNLCRF